jgi:hypothetical protein
MQFGLRRQRENCTTIEGGSGGAKASKPTIQDRLGCLAIGRQLFQVSAKTLELAGRYQPEAHYLRSGGLALDRSIILKYQTWFNSLNLQVETSDVN